MNANEPEVWILRSRVLFAQSIIKKQELQIEEWKRKYKDMHNLATQAMSRVHELEKAQQ